MIKQHVCTKSKNTHDFELVVGLLIETDSLDNHLGNRVGIAVAGGAPVLKVAIAHLSHVTRNPDAAAPVGYPGAEVVNTRRLVKPGQTPLIVLALVGVVCLDVPDVVLGEPVITTQS